MVNFEIEYNGPILSLNNYKSLSWRQLKKRTDKLKLNFIYLISQKKIPVLFNLELRIFHNTRLDVDNVVGTVKIFVDTLRHCKILKNDTSKYFPFLSVQYCPQIAKKTILFKIKGRQKK